MTRRAARILALILWIVVAPLVHGVVPWAISLLARRHGWAAGRPASWNFVGLVLVLVGAVSVIWSLVVHFVQMPETVELEWTPKYLLRRGPYAFTRNPMYVGALTLWLGWTLFYGSIAVAIGCLVLWLVMATLVRSEERRLEARFGDAYREYKNVVPRWLGRT